MGMITIEGYTAKKIAEEKNLSVLQAYDALLALKEHPKAGIGEAVKELLQRVKPKQQLKRKRQKKRSRSLVNCLRNKPQKVYKGDESGGLSSPFVYSVTDLYYTRSSSIHFRMLEKSMVSSP